MPAVPENPNAVRWTGNVYVLGDTLAAGGQGPAGLALRLSRPGLLAHDLTSEGQGLAGVLRQTAALASTAAVFKPSAIVLVCGLEDARDAGVRLESWGAAIVALLHALAEAYPRAGIFVLPPRIHGVRMGVKDDWNGVLPMPEGYNKATRRWVCRAQGHLLEVAREVPMVQILDPEISPAAYCDAVNLRPSGYQVITESIIAALTR